MAVHVDPRLRRSVAPPRARRRPRRRSWMAVASCALVVAAGLAVVGPAQAAPGPVISLAVGDSYSSGQGLRSAFQGCAVDSGAWPFSVVAPGQVAPIASTGSVTQRACSGATSTDVLAQLASPPVGIDLITVTVGANDVDLSGVITDCYLGDCTARANALDTGSILPGVEAVLARARSTGATVVLSTYPNLFARLPACSGCAITTNEQAAGSALLRRLDVSLRTAASRAGVLVADAEVTFAGHEPCGSSTCGGAWVNSLITGLFGVSAASFHLNGAGEQAEAAMVSQLLATWTGPRSADTLLPLNPSPTPIEGAATVAAAESCRTGATFRPLDALRVSSPSVFAAGATVTLSVSTDAGYRFKPPSATATASGTLDTTFVLPEAAVGSSFKVEAEGLSVHGTWTHLLAQPGLDATLPPCDLVPPVAQITTPTGSPTYVLNSSVAVGYRCSDDRRVSSCTANATGGRLNTATPGQASFVVTARDWAGNAASTSVPYAVRYVTLDRSPAWSSANPPLRVLRTQTAVVHFRIVDANGVGVVDPAAVLAPEVLTGPCAFGSPSPVKVVRPAPASDGGVWFTVPSSTAGSCTSVRIPLADGSTQAWAFEWV